MCVPELATGTVPISRLPNLLTVSFAKEPYFHRALFTAPISRLPTFLSRFCKRALHIRTRALHIR